MVFTLFSIIGSANRLGDRDDCGLLFGKGTKIYAKTITISK
jgi:hypothetical protein